MAIATIAPQQAITASRATATAMIGLFAEKGLSQRGVAADADDLCAGVVAVIGIFGLAFHSDLRFADRRDQLRPLRDDADRQVRAQPLVHDSRPRRHGRRRRHRPAAGPPDALSIAVQPAAAGRANWKPARSAAGSGGLKRLPWTTKQPCALRKRSCSTVSTPSATASMFRLAAMATTAAMIAASLASVVRSRTNERSIFKRETGKRLR
ncbi:MAG TPA: hypothetical protein DIT03_02240 [Candidatus Accumulibacter sp.]|nr:hypothetical protein [Accumulibacter sp.]HCN67093.1 hypothetical protein [Accumulibacter sp.]